MKRTLGLSLAGAVLAIADMRTTKRIRRSAAVCLIAALTACVPDQTPLSPLGESVRSSFPIGGGPLSTSVSYVTGLMIVESSALNFSGSGWGGWSCPAGKVALGGGVSGVRTQTSRPAGPNSVWPHYTYGSAEYGWVVQSAEAVSGKIWVVCADPMPGYEIVTSMAFNFSGSGWAGWSCPAGKVSLGGGVQNLIPVANRAAGPNSVWPHYSYGANDYGWVAQNGSGTGTTGSRIVVVCSDPVAGYEIVESAPMNYSPTGLAGWSCPNNKLVVGGGVQGLRTSSTRPAGPGTVTGFGYTYGPGEYGWLAANADNAQASGARIVPVCAAPSSAPGVAAPTAVGTDVPLAIVDGGALTGSIVFSNVATAGSTTVTPAAITDAVYVVPTGFSLGTPAVYYNITTTAVFTGSVEVCLVYPANSFAEGTVPRLLHFENNAWEDVTTTVDADSRTVCGSVTSFSPFALGTVWPTNTITGFFQPIDMGSVTNVAKAGQTIPIKFRVIDSNGTGVAGLTQSDIEFANLLSSQTTSATDGIETYASGSGLQYLGDGNYQYNWRTLKEYANQHRTFTMKIVKQNITYIGNDVTARFQFRK